MEIDTNKYKKQLEEEKQRLEGELQTVGRVNPNNPKDWEPIPTEKGSEPDKGDAAEHIEEYEGNTAILKSLEERYNAVLAALERIEKGTYGICEISGEKIEEDRLEANPAARTCKEHIDQEATLS